MTEVKVEHTVFFHNLDTKVIYSKQLKHLNSFPKYLRLELILASQHCHIHKPNETLIYIVNRNIQFLGEIEKLSFNLVVRA